MAGDTFVCIYNQVKYKAAPILVADFEAWVNDKLPPGATAGIDPNHACRHLPIPLPASERAAATKVVRGYAERLGQQLVGSEWNQQALDYLHQHGL